MNTRITIGFTGLLSQTPSTINGYMYSAVKEIDREFGKGFAKKNPQLVGDYIKACSNDFGSSVMALMMQNLGDDITKAIDELGANDELQ